MMTPVVGERRAHGVLVRKSPAPNPARNSMRAAAFTLMNAFMLQLTLASIPADDQLREDSGQAYSRSTVAAPAVRIFEADS